MGQMEPIRPIALIVEDDQTQRDLLSVLLEESDMHVIQCESAEAAELVLDKYCNSLALMITDIGLAGRMNGVQLAHIAASRNPRLDVVVTSGRAPPEPAGANTLYVLIFDPAVKDADYTISNILAESFPPAEVNALYTKFAEAYATGQAPVNLALVNDFSK